MGATLLLHVTTWQSITKNLASVLIILGYGGALTALLLLTKLANTTDVADLPCALSKGTTVHGKEIAVCCTRQTTAGKQLGTRQPCRFRS